MATTTVNASQTPATNPIAEIQANESTFTPKEIITALFISTITVLTSLLWGIPFGLIGGAASSILAWVAHASEGQPSAVASPAPALAAASANLVEELQLDRDEELHPHYAQVQASEDAAASNRHQNNIFDLVLFIETVRRAIYRQSLHYNHSVSLLYFMREHFHGMDFSRLTLQALKPIRFENGEEGYEMIIQSREPQGWIHLCIHKNDDILPRQGSACRFTRISQVTPFLDEYDVVLNHFSTFTLPFNGEEGLMTAFRQDFPDMDRCQVELQRCCPVNFNFHHEAHHGRAAYDVPYERGFELVFATPNGIVRYYADRTGQHIANQNSARNIAYLPM